MSRLLAHLDKVEQQAIAAGHGFGHLPLLTEHNAGWTRLDLADNVRPGYDQRFVQDHSPKSVLRLVRAHRDIAGQYTAARGNLEAMVAANRTGSGRTDDGVMDRQTARCAVLADVLAALARGYGLQEG